MKIILNIAIILATIALIAIAIGMAFKLMAQGIEYAIVKNEVVECNKLEEYSRVFKPHFYLTPWQKEMCDHHQIIINAPIKPPYEHQ